MPPSASDKGPGLNPAYVDVAVKRWQDFSLLEACTNVALGFVLALAIQAVVYPLFGITTTFVTDGALAVISTAVSLLRSYLVRRAFETFGCRQPGTTQEASRARSQAKARGASSCWRATQLAALSIPGSPGRNGGRRCARRIFARAPRAEEKRLAKHLLVLGVRVLTDLDRAPLAAYCQSYGRRVEAERKLKETPMLLKLPSGYVQHNP